MLWEYVAKMADLQGDRLNMAVFSGTLYKVACPVYANVHITLDKSLLIRYQKNMAMFNWSPCIS